MSVLVKTAEKQLQEIITAAINKAIADAIFNLKNGSISLLLNLQVKGDVK